MTANDSYDVVVVGSGPGGYVAAIRASQLGLRTAVVERDRLGGICLNWGCIPTKALLHGAEVADTLGELGRYGFSAENVTFDMAGLVKFSRSVSERLSGGVGFLLKKNGVDVVPGTAKLADKGVVAVTQEGGATRTLRADHVVLATGARPRALPGIVPERRGPEASRIWSYFEALVPERLPASLLVVGSGAIGSEFASLYRSLGTEVTLVEMAPQILPVEDAEVSATVRGVFEKRGIAVHTSSTLSDVTTTDTGVTATIVAADGSRTPVAAERLLLAAGIQANTEGLGLEDLGVELNRGFVKVDEWCRTNVFGLYAIGDVAGPPCLAHKASHEGVLCVEHLAGVPTHPLDHDFVPGCTYTTPQVASLGLTEAQARARGRPVEVGRFELSANGKALAMGDGTGFVKTVFDQGTGELLGAHMVGPDVTEQIQGFGIARALEATEEDLAGVVFAHPTLSEAMHESVLDALGRSLNH